MSDRVKEEYTEETSAPETFTDASYIPRDEMPRTPRIYPNGHLSDGGEKHTRRLPGSVVVVLCIACLLVGAGLNQLSTDLEENESKAAAATEAPEPAETVSRSVPLPAPASADETEIDTASLYELACSQVVGITAEISGYNIFGIPTGEAVSGTGFILTEDGYILTNYHVIENAIRTAGSIRVMLNNGESYTAEVVGYEKDDNDLAVLKIAAGDLTPVTAGRADAMHVGDTVYAVGNPLGELTYTMTKGMISALDREITTESTLTGDKSTVNMFQIDASVNAGNSGGPVYNTFGQVVGVVTARYRSDSLEGLGFAIPAEDAMDVARDIIESGFVRGKPYMGVIVQTVTEAVAEYYNQYYEDSMVVGAQVYALEEGSCAEAAGLRRGDIITALGDAAIRSSADLTAAEKEYRAQDTAELTIFREGEYLTLPITFGEKVPDGVENEEPGGNFYAEFGGNGNW